MATTITTPNMNLVLPVPLQELGPQWATDLIVALGSTGLGVDGHDHSPGKGVQLGTASININGDLAINGFNLTLIRSVRLTSQSVPLNLGTDTGCVSNVGGNLYWNNGSGTAVQITDGSTINSAALVSNVWPTKSNVTGSYTINASDGYVLYLVTTSGGTASLNLPPAVNVAVGRYYMVEDQTQSSETNSISIVPNGSDKINGVNSTYVFTQNAGSLLITTDGSSNWFVTPSASSLIRSASIVFANGTTLNRNSLTFDAGASAPQMVQADNTSASVVGQRTLVRAQNVTGGGSSTGGYLYLASGSGATAGDVYIELGSSPCLTLTPALASLTLPIAIAGAYASIGATPSQTGALRLASATAVNFRNAANSGDFSLIASDSSNNITVGSSSSANVSLTGGGNASVMAGSGSTAALNVNGTNIVAVTSTTAQFGNATINTLSGSLKRTTRTVTTSYAIDASGNDDRIFCNQSGAINITLPAPTNGRDIIIKDISGTAATNTITLIQHGSEKIEGVALSFVLNTNFAQLTLTSNGTDWFFV